MLCSEYQPGLSATYQRLELFADGVATYTRAYLARTGSRADARAALFWTALLDRESGLALERHAPVTTRQRTSEQYYDTHAAMRVASLATPYTRRQLGHLCALASNDLQFRSGSVERWSPEVMAQWRDWIVSDGRGQAAVRRDESMGMVLVEASERILESVADLRASDGAPPGLQDAPATFVKGVS